MKPLLSITHAIPIFAPLVGKRVGVVFYHGCGNAGDRWIETATHAMLIHFGITYSVVFPATTVGDSEVLLLGGGGNYGHPLCWVEANCREEARATGLPCVLLPQTCYGIEDARYQTAFVRDVTSQQYLKGSVLAPDLSMLWSPTPETLTPYGIGEFFTTSPEGLYQGRGVSTWSFITPMDLVQSMLACEIIYTDSLHCAIAGLTCGRRVVLHPTKLHKQRSWYETWGRRLGCEWSD